MPPDLPQTDRTAHDAFLKAYEDLVATTDRYVGAMRTSAVRKGDGWAINGQKLWCSGAGAAGRMRPGPS